MKGGTYSQKPSERPSAGSRARTQPSREDGYALQAMVISDAGNRHPPSVIARRPDWTDEVLICPSCSSRLHVLPERVEDCQGCGASYPLVEGIPILIDEANSVFNIADFVSGHPSYSQPESTTQQLFRRLIPKPSKNARSRRNYEELARRLALAGDLPRVLVVGGSRLGDGLEAIIDQPGLEFLETDVDFGPRCSIVCDAHSLPFENGAFDCVIAQAVLEHVVDPSRCVSEFYRVLRPRGLVYAETPFMQQVHAGRYDFTRYTHLGYRRLFRQFEEILNEAGAGPGTVLAWSYEHMLLSFFVGRRSRLAAKAFARITGSWTKYLDVFVIDRPGTLDAASVYNFMGIKSGTTLDDRELIRGYRGAQK